MSHKFEFYYFFCYTEHKMADNRVLYLGMADDIMAPLLLTPNLKVLYVISKLDPSYAGVERTWNGLKNEIKIILVNGSDEFSHRKIYKAENHTNIHYLESKSKILSDKEHEKRWELIFEYNNHIRTLIYFHHRNFLKEWPDEINDISHIMMMGAFSTGYLHDDYRKTYEDECNDTQIKIWINMLKSRTGEHFCLYASDHQHEHFPNQFMIKNESNRDGVKIRMIEVTDKTGADWIEQIKS